MRHFWGDSDKEFYGIRWYNTVIQSLTSIVHFISLSSGDGCQYAAYICPPPKKKYSKEYAFSTTLWRQLQGMESKVAWCVPNSNHEKVHF